MSEHKPIIPATNAGGSSPREITFEPAALRFRRDGWTAERQVAFIEKLADTGSVTAACAHVGMTRQSADRLRRRWAARSFRDAWDAAVDCTYADVELSAVERSRKGVVRPIFYKGEQVGEYRHFDERLTMFLLRHRRKQWYGKGTESPLPDDDDDDYRDGDPAILLDGGLEAIGWEPGDDEWEADEEPDGGDGRAGERGDDEDPRP